MERTRFDQLIRGLAAEQPRRAALRLLAGGTLGGALGSVWAVEGAGARCVKPNKRCKQKGGRKQKCCGGARCKGKRCKCGRGETGCGAACVDLQTDRRDCGRCNRGCDQGSPCLDGYCVTAWGGQGTGEGQFESPVAVAVAPNGDVYVADVGNSRIQHFRAGGGFLREWSTLRAGDDFTYPSGVAVSPRTGDVYVADRSNARIKQFSATGAFVRSWDTQRGRSFSDPMDVAVAPEGDVYVADAGNNLVMRFDAGGTFIQEWGGVWGDQPGEFKTPFGVAVARNGDVYVADLRNTRIQQFEADGTFVRLWGQRGTGDGEFEAINAIAVAANGDVYVVDASPSNRLQIFTANGTFRRTLGGRGSGLGELSRPLGVAVGRKGDVYVSDNTGHRVQRFDAP